MNKKTTALVIVGIVIVLIGGGLFFYNTNDDKSSTSEQSKQEETIEKQDKSVEDGSVEHASTKQTQPSQHDETSKESQTTATTELANTTNTSTASQSSQEKDNHQTTSTYDITKEVDNEQLKKVEAEDQHNSTAGNMMTVQSDNSLGNKHNLISFTNGQMSFTLMNRGKGSIDTKKIQFSSQKEKDNYHITLKWDDTTFTFTTNKEGQNLLKKQF